MPGLSIDRQLEMMRTVGIDVSDPRMLYIDKLTKAAVKARDPASLKDREEVLKPRRSGEAIYLAGLRVLGFTMSDRAHSIAQAWRRNAVIYCIDTDRIFAPDMSMADLLEELATAEDADRRARNAEKQARATDASQKRRARRKAEKLALIRDRWTDPKVSTAELIAESGLSRRTVYSELGPRFERKGPQHV